MSVKNAQVDRRKLLRLAGGAAAAMGLSDTAQPSSSEREFLIRGAHVLTMEPTIPDLVRGDLHVRDGVIVAVGEHLEAPGAQVIDGSDRIVMPGFVDTHWHLWNTFLRPLVRADEKVLGYFPSTLRLGPYCKPDDAYKSVRLSIAEAFVCGITTVHDWAHNVCSPQHADAELQALTDCGVRARFSYGAPQSLVGTSPMDIADVARVQKQWARHDGMLSIGANIRAVGSGSRDATLDTTKFEIAALRRLGLPYTIHGGPKGQIATLASNGLLGSDLLMVHPQGMTAEERQAIADSKTMYSTSPLIETSFSAVRSGYIQFAELETLKVPLSLSVDSSAVGNVDFFNMMRALVSSNWRRTDTDLKLQLNPKRVVELATIGGAHCLGLDNVTGSLKPGKRADLITIRTNDINMSPMGDPYYSIVYFGQPKNVDLVVANGRVVSRDGNLTTIDKSKSIREAVDAAEALAARAPKT